MKTARLVLLFVLLHSSLAYAAPFDNCEEYIKYGIPGDTGDPLCRKGFALSHHSERKTAVWVAEHLTRERMAGRLPRSDDFAPDPDLPPGKRAEVSDYKDSNYDRGHMAPGADMRWDPEAMRQSFYLSNISPQVGPQMNRGIWKQLEEKVRRWASQRGELYVYTGPIYAPDEPLIVIGANKVAAPTHFYKVIFDPVRVEAIAFIMPNTELRTENMPDYIVTVTEVEQMTGLNFLGNINAVIRTIVKSQKALELWQ
jgi:endonuclease G